MGQTLEVVGDVVLEPGTCYQINTTNGRSTIGIYRAIGPNWHSVRGGKNPKPTLRFTQQHASITIARDHITSIAAVEEPTGCSACQLVSASSLLHKKVKAPAATPAPILPAEPIPTAHAHSA